MRRWITRPRVWIGLSVSVLWGASMVALWLHEAGRAGAGLRQMGLSPETLMVSWNGCEYWMRIDHNGQRIGASHLIVLPRHGDGAPSEDDPPPGYVMHTRTRLVWSALTLRIPIDLALHARMNMNLEMETLQGRLVCHGWAATFQGFVEDKQLLYRLSIAPQADATTSTAPPIMIHARVPDEVFGAAPLNRPILMRDVVGPALARSDVFKPGARWTTQVSQPFGGRQRMALETRVEGLETIAWRGRDLEVWRVTEQMGSLLSNVWYDREGRLLRREIEGGLTMTRTHRHEVLATDSGFRHPPRWPPLDREVVKQRQSASSSRPDLERFVTLLPWM